MIDSFSISMPISFFSYENDEPLRIHVKQGDHVASIVLRLADTREHVVPLYWYPRLAKATPAQHANWEWIGEGEAIHWPEIDEDLEVQGIHEGRRSPEYYIEQKQVGSWFMPETSINSQAKLAGEPANISAKAAASRKTKVRVAPDPSPKNLRTAE